MEEKHETILQLHTKLKVSVTEAQENSAKDHKKIIVHDNKLDDFEQYSRKNCLRIFRLKEQDNEDNAAFYGILTVFNENCMLMLNYQISYKFNGNSYIKFNNIVATCL